MMLETKSEMYQAGWADFMDVNGECHFPDDLDYMEGWLDAQEAVEAIEWDNAIEAKIQLDAEVYENEHMYFEA